jgi:hypothetical protein
VFKPKNILKPKPARKSTKPDRNKENKISNTKANYYGRPIKKTKSMIPKPTNRDNVFKEINEQKERERSNASKMGSRKSSISKIPKLANVSEPGTKTEMLYQRAKAAMSKLNAPTSIPKPKKAASKP